MSAALASPQHTGTPAPAEALPCDAALPQLHTALNEARMTEVFAGLLGAKNGVKSGVQLQACRIERVKYRPGRNLAVAYLLDLQGPAGPHTQRVAARFCHGGEAARRHAKALARPQQPSPAGPALSHHAGLDMAAHWWPNDAKLAAAAVLADDEALRRHWLPGVLLAADAGNHLAHRVSLAQVVAEHRVTARVEIDTTGGRTLTVYAKADAEGRGPVTDAVMHSLWHSEARRSGRLRLPRTLGWQAGSGLHWQMAVPGVALLDAASRPCAVSAATAACAASAECAAYAASADCAADAGALVAALHGTSAPAAPALGEAELRHRLQDVVAVLGQVLPAARPQLDTVATVLLAGLPAALRSAPCTLHGDLHPRNLLVQDRSLSLIDLDSARRGPALLELGAWLADGLYRAALQGHDTAATAQAGRAFVAGYVAAGGERHGAQALAWATAWQLLCQRAWRCVVNLKLGRFPLAPRLLQHCAVLLASQAVHEVAA